MDSQEALLQHRTQSTGPSVALAFNFQSTGANDALNYLRRRLQASGMFHIEWKLPEMGSGSAPALDHEEAALAQETIAALADADRGRLNSYASVDTLFAELDRDD